MAGKRKSLVDRFKESYHYKRYAVIKGMIKEKGKKLLDIGCGASCESMKEGSFLEYIGYGQGIDIVKRKIRFPFKIGDMQKIPFKKDKFDVVTASEVIEHVDNPVKALKEVHRVLKKKGVAVITTPDNNIVFQIFWWLWERTIGSTFKDEHVSSYTKRKWIKIIKSLNLFEIEEIKRVWVMDLVIKLRKK